MTQDEIKAQRQVHRDRILDLQGEINVERARIGVLVAKCKHPKGYATSCMGDSGWSCPDCGYAR